MTVQKLILNEEALAKLGLGERAVYLIEYDLHSEQKIRKNLISKEEKKQLIERNKLAREFRNKLLFTLKFHLRATQHLESCWIIDESRLELAIDELEQFKAEMSSKGFKNVDERLRIIPILSTVEGIQNYEDKKTEFLLDFAMEHIQYLEKAEKKRRIPNGTMWRCKKAYEIVSELMGELKGHKRYRELIDTVEVLDHLIGKVETILKREKNLE